MIKNGKTDAAKAFKLTKLEDQTAMKEWTNAYNKCKGDMRKLMKTLKLKGKNQFFSYMFGRLAEKNQHDVTEAKKMQDLGKILKELF